VKLHIIDTDFTVCKIKSTDLIDFTREFVFISKTDEEISLVCESERIPRGVTVSEPGWRAMRVAGVLDFGMIGVLAKITGILAGVNVAVFVISTYNTDYILLKGMDLDRAVEALSENGYVFA